MCGEKLYLTFRANKFVLDFHGDDPVVMPTEAFLEKWELDSFTRRAYVTTDIKAAAQFRQYADDSASKILQRAFVKKYPAPSRPLPPFLDSHQVEGVTWVLTRSRSYLAHAPGAGKTLQAITAAIFTEGTGQVVFIVPPSLTVNWAREIELWAPRLGLAWPSISIIPESARQDFAGWRADFVVVPDSMLTRAWVLERLRSLKKKFVAVDEASRFKEPTAQRTIALFGGKLKDGRKSQGLVHDATHAVLLDGSPMPNRPLELWAPTFAMCPEAIDFMSEPEFGFRYCGAQMNKFGRWEFKHSAREEELKERLQKDFMHVVPEERLNHPERRRSLLFMNQDPRSTAHKSWERKHLHLINFDEIDEDMSQGEMASFRRELGIRKAPWIADYVSDRLTHKGESILLFAWHREVCFELEKLLRKFRPELIMGGTSDKTREWAFDAFQTGKLKLLILNIAAGGRGHNLQRADRVVFGEFSWNDETNKQAEKRAARKGRSQDMPVRVDYIVAPNTMDEPILQAVFRKADRVKKVIG